MVEKSVPIEKGRRRAASVGGRVCYEKKIKKIGAAGVEDEQERDRGGGVKGREK